MMHRDSKLLSDLRHVLAPRAFQQQDRSFDSTEEGASWTASSNLFLAGFFSLFFLSVLDKHMFCPNTKESPAALNGGGGAVKKLALILKASRYF